MEKALSRAFQRMEQLISEKFLSLMQALLCMQLEISETHLMHNSWLSLGFHPKAISQDNATSTNTSTIIERWGGGGSFALPGASTASFQHERNKIELDSTRRL